MTVPSEPWATLAVLIPVKRFEEAKLRLAPALDAADRASLARTMADCVLRAAEPLPVTVVCDDRDVASWAEAAGAQVVWTADLGLNGAVAKGVTHLAAAGFARVIVAHADLLFATPGSLGDLPREGVVLVPDRHDDGTNVASVPARIPFPWSYGPGSFGRHRRAATDLGIEPTVIRDRDLGWDVDTPADLVQMPT
ncbi:MAG TPA: 2-phospho-L-lactate guanylyltransferase [Acidimicrobiales bacterium]|nr:2-phospho-L-lactate guanylyltransferase [Acidimicrobiales bacterium]